MDTEKMSLIVNTLGYLLDLSGLGITLLNSPKISYGMFMRNSNNPTPEEKKKERRIKIGYWLIFIGLTLQMSQAFIKYI